VQASRSFQSRDVPFGTPLPKALCAVMKFRRLAQTVFLVIIIWGNAMAEDPGLRELALSGSEQELGFDFPASPWAFILETGFPEGSFTLVTISDGTTSLYYSSGGGVIGAGEHINVSNASKQAVQLAADNVQLFEPLNEALPPPTDGMVTMYIRSGQDLFYLTAEEDLLGEGEHPASNAFYAAHEVISQIRLLEEQNGT
jgi:hypothetical protein